MKNVNSNAHSTVGLDISCICEALGNGRTGLKAVWLVA